MFMDYFIDYSKSLQLANIVCEGVLVNNKMNIENIMKNMISKKLLELKSIGVINFLMIGAKNVGVNLVNVQM